MHRLLVKGNVDGAAMLFLWAIVDIHDYFQGWTELPSCGTIQREERSRGPPIRLQHRVIDVVDLKQ